MPGSPSFQPIPSPLASIALTRRSSASALSARMPTRAMPDVWCPVSLIVCRS
jgi:hypothetical protein